MIKFGVRKRLGSSVAPSLAEARITIAYSKSVREPGHRKDACDVIIRMSEYPSCGWCRVGGINVTATDWCPRAPNWGGFHVQRPLLYDQVVDRRM